MLQDAGPQGARALSRSFDIYYRDRARTARMDRLNARFVRPGMLAFDIGAHLGDRTGSFLRLGAKVVALEPQPRPFRALRLIYGQRAEVHLLPVAAGRQDGAAELFVNAANPTVSTLAADFISAASGAPGWEGQVWDRSYPVSLVTLDTLIATHGRPDFVKIDVEGHEADVLTGLSTPLPMLSFELTTIHRAVALASVARLAELGDYVYNFSIGEAHHLEHESWLSPEAMCEQISGLPHAVNSGDVFAKQVA